jgi:hypothetical protein
MTALAEAFRTFLFSVHSNFEPDLNKIPPSAVVGANLCVRRPVRSKRQGDHRGGRVADKKACTVHTTNIISQRQYFVARCLSSYVGNVFGLHSICVCLASDVGETHSSVPGHCKWEPSAMICCDWCTPADHVMRSAVGSKLQCHTSPPSLATNYALLGKFKKNNLSYSTSCQIVEQFLRCVRQCLRV